MTITTETDPSAVHPTTSGTAVLLIGIAGTGTLDGFEHAGTEAGTTTRVVRTDAFDALVVDVPSALFVGEDAEERMKDVEWLRPRAERHGAIVNAARAHGPGTSLMPVGFGSAFTGDASLAHAIAERTDQIGAFLEETSGCDEWSLRCRVSRRDAIERAKRRLAASAGGGSGAAYLAARKIAGEAELEAESHALGVVEDLIDALSDTIGGAAERAAVDAPDDDADSWLVAHVALLVDRSARAAFDLTLDEAAVAAEAEGVSLELSGPWAPYSFCPAWDDGDEGA